MKKTPHAPPARSTEIGTASHTKPLQWWLTAELGPTAARLNRLAEFQKIFVSAIPPHLRTTSRIAALEGGNLVIAAENGATAAVLKQMLPRLITLFREAQEENTTAEAKVTSIRLLVQPPAHEPLPARQRPPGSTVPAGFWSDLSSKLSDSPLKKTVDQLNRQRKGTQRRNPATEQELVVQAHKSVRPRMK